MIDGLNNQTEFYLLSLRGCDISKIIWIASGNWGDNQYSKVLDFLNFHYIKQFTWTRDNFK